MEDGRDNYADILEELDPLPELPETGDDRFFSKDALDFHYTTAPAENPLFPTWGSTGAEMAAIGAAAAANANVGMTPPPPAAATSPSLTPPRPATRSTSPLPSPSRRTPRPARAAAGSGGGKKRALPDHSQQARGKQAGQGRSSSSGRGGLAAAAVLPAVLPAVAVPAAPAAADRTVFLRQRLGGESVSSGNSSTSTGSDNGSASDDVTGEWEGGGGGGAKENVSGKRKQRRAGGVARRAKKPFAQSGGAVAAAAAAAGSLPATSAAGVSQAPSKSALRTRFGGSSSRRHRNSGETGGGLSDGGGSSSSASGGTTTTSVTSLSSHGGGGSSSSSSSSGGGNIDSGAYASWDSLVKPFKQQWDHVEGPAAAVAWSPSVGGGASGGRNRRGRGSRSGSFSPRLSTAVCSVFSMEPRPNCTTSFSVEQCSAQAHPMAVASYVLRVRCAGGAHIIRRTWDDIVSLCTMLGKAAGASGAVAGAAEAAAVEFTPADVLAPDAASGFLRDVLRRPGMACATPVRRFLELEYLDGTLRGGVADPNRANAARQVACLAALAVGNGVTASSAPPASATAAASEAVTTSGDSGDCSSEPSSVVAPLSASGGAHSLPAHPDAARDLAAVCRCLGELGASAFTPGGGSSADATSVPAVFRRAAPYWAGAGAGATAASGEGGGGAGRKGGGGRVAPQRGVAMVA